jgi:2-polyprenyl-6-methoxyphenol hydroxylase-like FAD-dependent oxidoreductase
MQLDSLHVIVAGAALGGAATALLLARAGARVTVLERIARPRAVGAGIALAENGLAVLESLGLGPAISRHAHDVGPARIVDAHGRVLLTPREPMPRVAMIRRATLQSILLDALASEPRVETVFGAEVVRATAVGAVEARVGDRALHLQGDLVVGADGVRSRVRESARFDVRLRPPGIPYLRTLVPEGLARNEEAWTAAGLFGSFGVDGGTYVYASAGSRACRDAVAARDLDALRAAWAEAYPPSREILAAVGSWESLIVNHVLRVDCRRWYDGRIVLIGDSAHAMAPNLGQGGNSALVDAAVLLDELRRSDDVDAALARYDARRRPAVRAVADTSARLGMLAELRWAPARWLRDRVVMPLADRAATAETTAAMLQESPRALVAIGRGAP